MLMVSRQEDFSTNCTARLVSEGDKSRRLQLEVVAEVWGGARGGWEAGGGGGSRTQLGACRLNDPNEQETDLGGIQVHCLYSSFWKMIYVLVLLESEFYHFDLIFQNLDERRTGPR